MSEFGMNSPLPNESKLVERFASFLRGVFALALLPVLIPGKVALFLLSFFDRERLIQRFYQSDQNSNENETVDGHEGKLRKNLV